MSLGEVIICGDVDRQGEYIFHFQCPECGHAIAGKCGDASFGIGGRWRKKQAGAFHVDALDKAERARLSNPVMGPGSRERGVLGNARRYPERGFRQIVAERASLISGRPCRHRLLGSVKPPAFRSATLVTCQSGVTAPPSSTPRWWRGIGGRNLRLVTPA